VRALHDATDGWPREWRMSEELDGASPKDFATCSKANRRRELGDRSVSAYRNWAFLEKPAEGQSNWGGWTKARLGLGI
jgi:hypothetical protein